MANKVQYGLKNVNYAVVTETTSGGVTTSSYGTPKPIKGAVTLSLSPSGDASQFRADDSNYFTYGANSGYEGSYECAGFPSDFYEDVWGAQRDDDDVLTEYTNDQTKYVALLFEIDGDVKATRYCFYKCFFKKPSIEAETTSEDGNEPKTVSSDITVSPRPDDGLVKSWADDATDSTAYSGWYSSVFVPTFTP